MNDTERFRNNLLASDRQDSESTIQVLDYIWTTADYDDYRIVEFMAGCIEATHEVGEELDINRVY